MDYIIPMLDSLSLDDANKVKQSMSFEALEETLGALKMEEALFMTYAAKKSFAKTIAKTSDNRYLKH